MRLVSLLPTRFFGLSRSCGATILVSEGSVAGIYLDDGSKDFTVKNNVVARVGGAKYTVFFYPGGRYDCLIDWRREPWEAWTRRLEGRYEPHTSLADSLFVDPGRLDYRVQEGSPALEKGFVNVDLSRAGLQEDFPFREKVREDP
jgi:hypothetical protein